MKRATDAQREVLLAMAPKNRPFIPMTSSEITVRTGQVARFAPARGSVVDRLRGLEKKAMVELVGKRPLRWQITELGSAEVA